MSAEPRPRSSHPTRPPAAAPRAFLLPAPLRYIAEQIPLSQLLVTCGPLAEVRPLFRHIVSELARALADVEAQCTFAVCEGGISAESVYLAEGGTRLTLRGVAWGQAIQGAAPSAAAALAGRSAELLRAFGRIVRALLPPPRAGGAAPPPPREIALADAEFGVTLYSGEAIIISAAAAGAGAAAGGGATARRAAGSSGGGGSARDSSELTGLPVLFSTAAAAPSSFAATAAAAAALEAAAPAHAAAVTGSLDDECAWLAPRVESGGEEEGGADMARGGAPAVTARWLDAERGAAARGTVCPDVLVVGAAVGEATLCLDAVRPAADGYAPALGGARAAARRVPVRVLARAPSPVLAAILDAADPRQEDSAAIATVRLLALLLDGEVSGGGGSGGDSGGGGSGGFAKVARQIAAVLDFNAVPGAPGAAADADADGTGAHDADALAALVCALEEADPALPSGLSGVPAGDDDDGETLRLGAASGGAAAARRVRWIAHLARHPYFESAPSPADIAGEFVAYAAPLRARAARAAARLGATGGA